MNILDIDFDLGFLRDVTGLLDEHLERIDREYQRTDDANVYDRANHTVGLGLVACQNYFLETISLLHVEKEWALDQAPIHAASGLPLVALTNSLANFWKHRPEWGKPLPSRKRAVVHLRALGVDPDQDPWPVANALYAMLHPHPLRFSSLIPFLQRWRDGIRESEGR